MGHALSARLQGQRLVAADPPRRPRVLVADDDPRVRDVLFDSIGGLGYDVVAVGDGQAALAVLRSPDSHIRVVVLDVHMPRLDGFAVCRQIRAAGDHPYVYVILLTALADPESHRQGMAAGADDFLTKPFQMEQLAARIGVARRILRLEEEVRELRKLLPICMYCRRVHDQSGRWTPIELYLAQCGQGDLTHGLCPDCSSVVNV